MRLICLFTGILILSSSVTSASTTVEFAEAQHLDRRQLISQPINVSPNVPSVSIFTRVHFPYPSIPLTTPTPSQTMPLETSSTPDATILAGERIDLTSVTLTGARASGGNITLRDDIDLAATPANSVKIFSPTHVATGGNVLLVPHWTIGPIAFSGVDSQARAVSAGTPILPTNVPLPAPFALFLSGLALLWPISRRPIPNAE